MSAGRDDTSLLITLTARHLAPDLPISVSVRNEDNEIPARQAGATTVINPVSFSVLLLPGSFHVLHFSFYLSDLSSSHGLVILHFLPSIPAFFGIPVRKITLLISFLYFSFLFPSFSFFFF